MKANSLQLHCVPVPSEIQTGGVHCTVHCTVHSTYNNTLLLAPINVFVKLYDRQII